MAALSGIRSIVRMFAIYAVFWAVPVFGFSLANIKRHDYLPFGEELLAPAGGRSASIGYTSGDGVRQQFTQQERDIETGLDYFGARYYASVQGRFTSPDPLLSSGTVDEPQSWNRYSYVWNNPLNLTDPDGLYVFDKNVGDSERRKFNAALAQARANLQQIGKTYGTNSNEYKKAERALNAYGAEGVNNGVTIHTQAGLGHNQTQTAGVPGQKTADNPTGQDIRVTFDKKYLDSDVLGASIGHEGVHVANMVHRILCVMMRMISVGTVTAHDRHDDRAVHERAIRLEPFIVAASMRHGVDARILRAICFVEARYRINAVSPKGARGPMQFMPDTAACYGFRDPHDPEQAIDAATRYLRDLLRKFDGRVDLAVAAYNAGEGAVSSFMTGKPLILRDGRIVNARGVVPEVFRRTWRREDMSDQFLPC